MRYGEITFAALALTLTLGLGGCAEYMNHHGHPGGGHMVKVDEAIAVIVPTTGSAVSGKIHFVSVPGGVHVVGEVRGLVPNSEHGFHIHEFGDVSSADGKSAGGHYNPEGHPHADVRVQPHHAGDLGNLKADGAGVGKVDLVVKGISIAGHMNPIIGRGVVVHAKPDDLKTQPTGDAGGRIGVGVIGVAKSGIAATLPAK